MAAELPRPGVEVIQVFRTVSPTVVTPTLVPCVVGVCRQVVEVYSSTATGSTELNPSALISLPGAFVAKNAVGTPAVYSGLDGLKLVLSITNGPDVEITFSGSSLTPASVVAQIATAFLDNAVTNALVTLSPDKLSFQVRTAGVGPYETLTVVESSDAAVLTAFGLKAGYVYPGSDAYSQRKLTVPLQSFPDPRSNLDQLTVEPSSVRMFLGLGSGTNLKEASKTSSYLRRGGGGTSATLTGSVNIETTSALYGTGGTLDGKSLTVTLDGGSDTTVAMGVGAAAPANAVDLIAKINSALGARIARNSSSLLSLQSQTKGTASSVKVSGTAAAVLGLSTTAVNGAHSVAIVDDGNGDTFSPLLKVLGANFSAAGTSAVVTGCVDLSTLTYPADIVGKDITLSVNGSIPQTFVFPTTANAAAVLTKLNDFFGPAVVATMNVSNELVLTTVSTGEDASVDVIGGTALSALGLVPSLVGVTDLGDVLPDLTEFNSTKLKMNLGGTTVEHTFTGLTVSSTVTDLVSSLNGNTSFSALAVAFASSSSLGIRLKNGGTNHPLTVLVASSSDASALLGFSPGSTVYFFHFEGGGHPPVSGDDVYVDGKLIGKITAVSPGGLTDRLRLNKQLTINSAYGLSYHLVANGLTGVSVTARPDPELYVAGDGTPTIKHNLLRDSGGVAYPLQQATIYLSYRAVRMDVTARAKVPGLLQVDSTTSLSSNLSPISTDNPLALGMYFALLNAPGAQVSGLGVDEVSESEPYGTVAAYQRAAEALEAYEVYAIAPLTHDNSVAEIFSTHVSAMSAPANRGERVCLFNFSEPSKTLDTLVSSGVRGNGVPGSSTQFNTGAANLSSLVLAAGVNPVGTIPASAGLFLNIAQSNKNFSVASIAGGVVTIRTAFTAVENEDGFYSTTDLSTSPLPTTLIDEPFSIKIRGESLVQTDGTPNKTGISETYSSLARSYMNRRFWSIVPEQCAATVDGMEQILDGFYLCAAIAGMIAHQPPQQSFTNFPMTGFTRVLGSNDFFTERQLNVMAGGGNYIIVQDSTGAPLTARMALTTDMTSIETRTDSIQKVVDFTAKFMRRGLRAYIGRYNITQGFLDSLGHVVQGLLGFLTDIGVLIGANLNNIVQDESAPDTVLIDVTLDVPYPCNYIRLTLVI